MLVAVESLLDDDAVSAADLDRVRPQVVDALGGLVIGAGYVAAPHVLADQEYGFEWWTAPAPPTGAAVHQPGAGKREFLDYTRQSWFTVSRDTGRRHVNGPYVDYLCTDEYTLTFTVPASEAARSRAWWARTCSSGNSSMSCNRSCGGWDRERPS